MPYDQEHLLLRTVELYFEKGLTQQEIGRRLHVTRWQVGRWIQHAKEQGIVQIRIVHPKARAHDLERRLVATGLLADAVVVPTSSDPASNRFTVAGAAASYLADLRPSPKSVAMSWGFTMSELAEQIPPSWVSNVSIIQANGGLARPGPKDPMSTLKKMATQGDGSGTYLMAPAIVNSVELAQGLLKEPSISSVLQQARDADVTLFSLGAVGQDSVLVASGCVNPTDVEELRKVGCVGDVLARYIDAHGNPVSACLDARTVGLTLGDVRNARFAIAVTAGQAKHLIAKAVVASGLCKVLVTDSQTAKFLIENVTTRQ